MGSTISPSKNNFLLDKLTIPPDCWLILEQVKRKPLSWEVLIFINTWNNFQVLVPLKTVRQGFRHLPLCARDGSTLEPASVFVHIDLKDQLDISIKKGIVNAKKKAIVPPKTERLRETGLPNIGKSVFMSVNFIFTNYWWGFQVITNQLSDYKSII